MPLLHDKKKKFPQLLDKKLTLYQTKVSGTDFILFSKLFSQKFHDVSMLQVFLFLLYCTVVLLHIHGKLVGGPGGSWGGG